MQLAPFDGTLEHGADVLRLVAVRVVHDEFGATVYGNDPGGTNEEPGFFPDFSHDGISRRLVELDRASRRGPDAALALLDEEERPGGVVHDPGDGGEEDPLVPDR